LHSFELFRRVASMNETPSVEQNVYNKTSRVLLQSLLSSKNFIDSTFAMFINVTCVKSVM